MLLEIPEQDRVDDSNEIEVNSLPFSIFPFFHLKKESIADL